MLWPAEALRQRMRHSVIFVFSILISKFFFSFYKTQIQMYNVLSALAAVLRQRMRHSLARGGFPPFLPFLSSLFIVTFYPVFLFFFLLIPPSPLFSSSLTSPSLRDAKSTRGQKGAPSTIWNFLFCCLENQRLAFLNYGARASSYMNMLLCSEVKLEMWKRFPCYRDSSKLLVIEIRTIHHQWLLCHHHLHLQQTISKNVSPKLIGRPQ